METSLAALMSKWRNPTPPQPRLLLSSVLATMFDVYPRFIRTNVFSSGGGIRRLGSQLMCDGWSGGNNVEIADTTQSGHQHQQQHMHSNREGKMMFYFLRKMNLRKDSVGFVNRTVVLIQRSAGMADASDDIYGSY